MFLLHFCGQALLQECLCDPGERQSSSQKEQGQSSMCHLAYQRLLQQTPHTVQSLIRHIGIFSVQPAAGPVEIVVPFAWVVPVLRCEPKQGSV